MPGFLKYDHIHFSWIHKHYKTSIREDILYLVLFAGCSLLSKPGHVVDDGGKVSGPPQLHSLQGLMVGLHHSLHPRTVRVLRVSIQGKLMRYLLTGRGRKEGKEGGGRKEKKKGGEGGREGGEEGCKHI